LKLGVLSGFLRSDEADTELKKLKWHISALRFHPSSCVTCTWNIQCSTMNSEIEFFLGPCHSKEHALAPYNESNLRYCTMLNTMHL
jgi:hypothetical protein